MAGDVRVEIRHRELAEFARSDDMRRGLLDAAEPVVRGSQQSAPKDTGFGAASIRAEAVLDGPTWTAHVGWSRNAYYMIFHERGTRYLPARPFMVPTLEGLSI